MTVAGSPRAGLAQRGWPISREPAAIVAYVLTIDLVAAVLASVAVVRTGSASARQWWVLLFLCALALAFEEGSRRVGRLQIRLSNDLKRDMTSVWSVAATVALMPSLAVGLHVVIFTYIWFRQERPAGETLYRKIGSRSTAVLGCLGAGVAMRAVLHHQGSLPVLAGGALAVVVVVVVHTVINRGLVSVALIILGARGPQLLGRVDDNLVELATLCLGGLVSLAALYQPWLCLLVLAPMVSLQRGSLVRELETAATTDAKTGLLNAVALEHLGQREIAHAERESSALAVLIVDIDRFKLVNDRYGHLVGDAVLKGVGRALTMGLREYDTVGRFGGEEFVAILPAAQESEALVVAERLRAHVEALRVADLDSRVEAGGDDQLSVSIGVSCFDTHGRSMPDLLFAADTALYRAKSEGRNRVVLASREVEGPARDTVAL